MTEYGYEVEIRIPFKSLRYQSTETQSWGFNVVRVVQHSGFEDSWAPARRAGASFLGQSGTLDGLTDLRRGLVLDVNPEATQRTVGALGIKPRDAQRLLDPDQRRLLESCASLIALSIERDQSVLEAHEAQMRVQTPGAGDRVYESSLLWVALQPAASCCPLVRLATDSFTSKLASRRVACTV